MPVCGRPQSRFRQRLAAGALLLLLFVRLSVAQHAALTPAYLCELLAAVALGGCLWWVAHRQVGFGGASVALALYSSAPLVLHPAAGALGALGLFGMLYTGVGVAHALQGPRRKWLPRIMLMAALTAYTGGCAPPAAAAGLLLALAAMLYLAEGKRSLLPLLFLVWVAVAALAFAAAHALPLSYPESSPRFTEAAAVQNAGLLAALLLAGVLWLSSRRSRYFGNSAPLLAAFVLLLLARVTNGQSLFWALPLVLLFAGGCFADALEGRHGRIWTVVLLLLTIVQFVASF